MWVTQVLSIVCFRNWLIIMGNNTAEKRKHIHKKKIKDGGLKVVSIKEFIMSLKLIWMKKS